MFMSGMEQEEFFVPTFFNLTTQDFCRELNMEWAVSWNGQRQRNSRIEG